MRKMPRTSEKEAVRQTDPDYAPHPEMFDNLSHQQIHAAVRLLNPAVLSAGQQNWQGSSTGLSTAVEQAHTDIRAAIADGWRGAAAQSAVEAVRDFERTGQQLAEVMAAVAQRLGQAGDAAEALRAAVPAPSSAEPDLSAALLDPGQATENTATQKAAESARQDVVQAMNTIYSGAFIPTGMGIPAFPDAVVSDSTPTATSLTTPVQDAAAVVSRRTPAAQPIAAPADTTGIPSTVASGQNIAASGQNIAAANETQPAVVSSTVGTPSGTGTTSAPSTTVAAATEAPAATTSAAVPDRNAPTGSSTPPSTGGSTVAAGMTAPGTGTSTAQSEERKREERRREPSGDAAVTGMGAGAMGGLMGGALAASETPRQGPSTAARSAPTRDNDEFHYIDDELTFLEPADEAGELIGAMDPTIPPVVGEWTEHE